MPCNSKNQRHLQQLNARVQGQPQPLQQPPQQPLQELPVHYLAEQPLQQEDYPAEQPQQEEDVFTATPSCSTAQWESLALLCSFNVRTNSQQMRAYTGQQIELHPPPPPPPPQQALETPRSQQRHTSRLQVEGEEISPTYRRLPSLNINTCSDLYFIPDAGFYYTPFYTD